MAHSCQVGGAEICWTTRGICEFLNLTLAGERVVYLAGIIDAGYEVRIKKSRPVKRRDLHSFRTLLSLLAYCCSRR